LFWLPSSLRETGLRARLAGPPPHGTRDAVTAGQIPGVPVFTASPGPEGPAGASWLPAATQGPRLRLAQLAPRPAAVTSSGRSAAGPLAPPGGLAWHPPAPAAPAWNDLPGQAADG